MSSSDGSSAARASSASTASLWSSASGSAAALPGRPAGAGRRRQPAGGGRLFVTTDEHARAHLRTALLIQLRRDGPSTPDQLAGRIGASRTGVLQQLRGLEAAGLVTKETIRHGVGRPRHVYDVAPEAQHLFPNNYEGLAAGLLAALGAMGGTSLVKAAFAARRRELAKALRRRVEERVGPGAPLVARVRELAVIQDELGYLAEVIVGPDGGILLREHNCAIYRIARDCAAACAAELDLFRDVLQAEVERETHIAAGDRCCTYRITYPKSAARDGPSPQLRRRATE